MADSPTRCGTPLQPGTGSWPPLRSSMTWQSASSSHRGRLVPGGQFAGMPSGQAWAEPEPYLSSAAMALSAGHDQSCAAALDAADGLLERRPAGQEPGIQKSRGGSNARDTLV